MRESRARYSPPRRPRCRCPTWPCSGGRSGGRRPGLRQPGEPEGPAAGQRRARGPELLLQPDSGPASLPAPALRGEDHPRGGNWEDCDRHDLPPFLLLPPLLGEAGWGRWVPVHPGLTAVHFCSSTHLVLDQEYWSVTKLSPKFTHKVCRALCPPKGIVNPKLAQEEQSINFEILCLK